METTYENNYYIRKQSCCSYAVIPPFDVVLDVWVCKTTYSLLLCLEVNMKLRINKSNSHRVGSPIPTFHLSQCPQSIKFNIHHNYDLAYPC